jgi:hypothetical protein
MVVANFAAAAGCAFDIDLNFLFASAASTIGWGHIDPVDTARSVLGRTPVKFGAQAPRKAH